MSKSRVRFGILIVLWTVLLGLASQRHLLAHAPLESKNRWGLGAQLGEPSGLQSRVWLNVRNALDFTLAYSFQESFLIAGSYVWNFTQAVPGELKKFHIHPYAGAGIFLSVHSGFISDSVHTGIRIPFGLEYVFPGSPVSVFLDIAVAVGVIPSTDVNIQGAIGGRYYF
jgi:hypothetical protein